MAAMKENTSHKGDGATRIYSGNFQNDSRCEISRLFTQLSSWSREREESQKQLDSLLATLHHTVFVGLFLVELITVDVIPVDLIIEGLTPEDINDVEAILVQVILCRS